VAVGESVESAADASFTGASSAPRGRRAALGAVAALAVVVGGLALVDAQGDDPAEEDAAAASEETTTTERRRRTTRTTQPVDEPPVTVPGGTGLRVVSFGSSSLQVTNLDTGEQVAIPGASSGGFYGDGVARGTGLVFIGATRRVTYLPDLVADGPTVDLGEGDQVLASDEPDRVWILAGDPYSPQGSTARETDLTGRVTAGPTPLPPGITPVGGVQGGLLVGTPDGIFIMDRQGDARRVARGTALGMFGSNVIHQACGADLDCAVHITDVVTGEQRRIEAPDELFVTGFGVGLSNGVSPDGRFLISMTYSNDSGAATLHIHDLVAGGAVRSVGPDVMGNGGFVAWSPDSQWLILSAPYGGPTTANATSAAMRMEDGAVFPLDLPTGDYFGMVVLPTAAP
jgi:hypothetical protein